MDGLRRSPLDHRHRALGATMTEFGGWDMPLDYGSVVAEHVSVRTACGVFDLSHLGQLEISGPGAEATVQRALANDAAALPVGRAHYTLCLDADAGIIDDLIVYRRAQEHYLAVPNAANTDAVRDVLSAASEGAVEVRARAWACLAVQGPRSTEILAAAGIDAEGLAFLDHAALDDQPGPEPAVLARTGYTGERGYELFVPAEDAEGHWDALLAAGAAPVGLGARDTLRLEVGYPLHGNDISRATTPVEARLGWAVAAGTGFIGEAAYLRAKKEGRPRRLRGLRAVDRGIPRAGCEIRRDGRAVGEVTSGTFSPTRRIGIALGYVDASVELGDPVDVDVRGKSVPAEVVRPPFVDADPKA